MSCELWRSVFVPKTPALLATEPALWSLKQGDARVRFLRAVGPQRCGIVAEGFLLYDGRMGYTASVAEGPGRAQWSVRLSVSLSRAETNDLFLSGDSMVSWPAEGLVADRDENPRLERSGMFVSEIAAKPEGLTITYGDHDQAERATALLRMQFAQIGIEEET
jgi:hypothetical protein